MKRILIWGAAGLGVIVLILAALPFLVSVDTYRGAIERAAHEATGRTLKIAGPMRLTVFPEIGITAQDVHFSNMAGGHAADMASVGALRIGVSTLPLLTGTIRVSNITLDQPEIHLEADASGRTNWTFARPAKTGEAGGGLPKNLSFSGIDIRGGAISYRDDASGKALALDNVNLHMDLTAMDAPAALTGDMIYAGRKITVEGHIATLQSLSEGGRTGLQLALKSDLLNAAFDGAIAPDRSLAGSIDASSPSARNLGAWLGKQMPAGGGLGKLTLKGKVKHTTGLTDLEQLAVTLDKITVTGALAVETGGVRPRVTGKLAAGMLDLNPYMQTGSATGTSTAGASATGWSRTPIAVDALRLFDADVALTVKGLLVRKLAIGQTSLHAVLDDGVLQTNLDPMTLYGGQGRARVSLDAHGRIPVLRANLAFDNVSVASLLGDMLGVSRIEGVGQLTLDVAGAGASTDAIVHDLSGKGALAVANGRIRGVNLGMVARTVKTALSGQATGDGASTDFTRMGGSFVIARGVLTSNDFLLTGPVLSATGKGNIDIGNQTIDFSITPKADVALADVSVPFRVRGPWTKPGYAPDLAGLAGGVVRGLASGQGAGGLLGGLLGGKSSAGSATPPPQKKETGMGGLLGGLLGR